MALWGNGLTRNLLGRADGLLRGEDEFGLIVRGGWRLGMVFGGRPRWFVTFASAPGLGSAISPSLTCSSVSSAARCTAPQGQAP
jgi:hypothetical protein